MKESIDDKIVTKIKKAEKGTLYFADDFLSFGNSKSVSKALERMVHHHSLHRVARGIYARLATDPILGPLKPSTEEIAEAIRRRDKSRIVPSGNLALNALGLSKQVQMNVVYYTDGSARTIDLGKRTIVFKKTAPRYLATIGKISTLVIQALKEIGKDNLTAQQEQIILAHLKNEEAYKLEHDINLAPEWIRIIMRKAIKKE